MHKPTKTKLALRIETVRVLSTPKLAEIAGGQRPPRPGTWEPSVCNPYSCYICG